MTIFVSDRTKRQVERWLEKELAPILAPTLTAQKARAERCRQVIFARCNAHSFTHVSDILEGLGEGYFCDRVMGQLKYMAGRKQIIRIGTRKDYSYKLVK